MSEFHTFLRPDVEKLGPQVGEVYSPEYKRYDEGTRYGYHDQALRHTMQEQAAQTFNRLLYAAAVQEVHGRFPDSDAMAQAAEVVEATLG